MPRAGVGLFLLRQYEPLLVPESQVKGDTHCQQYRGKGQANGDRCGLQGARRRIAAAREAVPAFGIATECGFGRRPPETVLPLLDLHARVASLAEE